MSSHGDRTPLVLASVAFALGLLIVVGAALLPLVSVESSSASASAPASAAQSATPVTITATPSVTVSSTRTLLHEEGPSILATAAVPALVSLVVGALLLGWSATGRRGYLGIAWALTSLLLAAALLALLTIGIVVLPVGGLLLLACVLASRPQPAPVRIES